MWCRLFYWAVMSAVVACCAFDTATIIAANWSHIIPILLNTADIFLSCDHGIVKLASKPEKVTRNCSMPFDGKMSMPTWNVYDLYPSMRCTTLHDFLYEYVVISWKFLPNFSVNHFTIAFSAWLTSSRHSFFLAYGVSKCYE